MTDEFLKYPKLNTIFKRGKKGAIILNEYSNPIFNYLKDNYWWVSEKIDGTNIRIKWNCENKTVEFAGKDTRSEIPEHLFDKLCDIFSVSLFESKYPETSMILFGEGYGKDIQNGHKYIPDDVNFILFDINIGGKWLSPDNIDDIGHKLGIDVVKRFEPMTLTDIIKLIKDGGFKTHIANSDIIAEGVVFRPMVDIYDYEGHPFWGKLKVKDFNKVLVNGEIYYKH